MNRKIVLLMTVIMILTSAIVANAQDGEAYTSNETMLRLVLPDGWDVEYDDEFETLYLTGDGIAIEVSSPLTLQMFGYDDITKANEFLSVFIQDSGWTAGDADIQEVNDRLLTIAEYYIEDEDFDGMLVAVPLSNDQYALVDTYEWAGSADMELILEIASTIEAIEAIELEHYAGDWREAIAELEVLELIGIGGSIVFVEDRAFFSGQGLFFTPLAENSPQSNFVMAGELNYTQSVSASSPDLESCSLLARVQTDNTGTTTSFIEVALNSTEVLDYVNFVGNDTPHFQEFSEIDLDEPHHILMIVSGDSLTLFHNGTMLGRDLPIESSSGSFGVALRGRGRTAECVGENIWVYRIPEIEDGVCRASADGNINKRSGAGTTFDVAGQLLAGTAQEVIGQASGEGGFVWWQLEDESWVRNDVVRLSGDCRGIPTVED